MWYEHWLSVLVPLTRFAYETKKTSPCGMSTGCQCWYHLQGLLTKPKKLAMWYEHRLSVLVPLTRFAYETKKKLAMWYEHRLSVLVPLTRFA
jgi:hypothetical protein